MVKLILVRHGESEYNILKKISGQLDVPLSALGIKQAEIGAKYILEKKKIDAIYSSDLSRAVNTVKPIADALGLPIHTEKGLREIDLGAWTDGYFSEIREKYHTEYQAYQRGARATGGESKDDACQRAMKTIMEIVEKENGKTVLIGTHNGIVRVLLRYIFEQSGDPLQEVPLIPNNSLTEIIFDDGKFSVAKIGESTFLEGIVTMQDKNLL